MRLEGSLLLLVKLQKLAILLDDLLIQHLELLLKFFALLLEVLALGLLCVVLLDGRQGVSAGCHEEFVFGDWGLFSRRCASRGLLVQFLDLLLEVVSPEPLRRELIDLVDPFVAEKQLEELVLGIVRCSRQARRAGPIDRVNVATITTRLRSASLAIPWGLAFSAALLCSVCP